MLNFEINRSDSVRTGRVQIKFQRYGSLFNNQLNGTRHHTSTSLTIRRRLTA
ncbi:unnamed protein product [Schistosoma mattheei]|uniref:Uncharacterized protein n=1 Tax=Schistosoma mattheei TaxID=31246 RepID=A0A183PIV8_9TREM|nr:unnamed protein product [Schistosoma mattheei]